MKTALLCLLALLYEAALGKPTRERHSNSYTTSTYYSYVIISDETYRFSEDGQIASYSNISLSEVRGRLYDAGEHFNCIIIESRNANSTLSVPSPPPAPFIILLPLTDCEHYTQVQFAQDIGAAGVLFYSSSRSSRLTGYHSTVAIVVASVVMEDHELESIRKVLDLNNTIITIQTKNKTTAYHTSQTFYFVVFAFSVLVLLSLTWFIITYVRRCHDYCARSHTRRRTRRAATRAINNLSTRKYKSTKGDTQSISSEDEPTCAVCLESFKQNDVLRTLPCCHEFHKKCIDPWLTSKGTCPLCKCHIFNRQASRGSPSVTLNTTSDTLELASHVELDEEEMNSSENQQERLNNNDEVESVININ